MQVSPHEFDPLARRDRDRDDGRCRACYQPKAAHPTRDWAEARPLGDKTAAR